MPGTKPPWFNPERYKKERQEGVLQMDNWPGIDLMTEHEKMWDGILKNDYSRYLLAELFSCTGVFTPGKRDEYHQGQRDIGLRFFNTVEGMKPGAYASIQKQHKEIRDAGRPSGTDD